MMPVLVPLSVKDHTPPRQAWPGQVPEQVPVVGGVQVSGVLVMPAQIASLSLLTSVKVQPESQVAASAGSKPVAHSASVLVPEPSGVHEARLEQTSVAVAELGETRPRAKLHHATSSLVSSGVSLSSPTAAQAAAERI